LKEYGLDDVVSELQDVETAVKDKLDDVVSELQDVKTAVQDVDIGVTGVTDRLDDVLSALQDVEAAVKDNGLNGLWPNIVTVAIVWGLVSILGTAAWHSKWRYALQYGINTSQVLIEKEPHDCEFLTSPLGKKKLPLRTSRLHTSMGHFYDRTAHCFVR
jgi:hypothetical protein